MSWEHLKDAYRTRLDNIPAKAVLAVIVGEATIASADGMAALLSAERIATMSEVKERTVRRVVQCFSVLGLARRVEIEFRGRLCDAVEVNLNLLGADLREDFRRAYGAARSSCGNGPRDIGSAVPGTVFLVPRTAQTVPGTKPPNPLIGGSTAVQLGFNTPQPPADAVGKNHHAVELAVDQVMNALAIANRRKRRLLQDVILLESEKGEPPQSVALAMIAAWQKKAKFGHVLYPCRFERFFGDGIWRDDRQWPWDKQALRELDSQHGQATVGMR